MKNALITIINGEITYFKDNNGEYSKEMTKINYAINMANTDRNIGPAILNCYRQGNLFDKIKPYIMKSVQATIEERPTDNGSKYVITKIDNKEI